VCFDIWCRGCRPDRDIREEEEVTLTGNGLRRPPETPFATLHHIERLVLVLTSLLSVIYTFFTRLEARQPLWLGFKIRLSMCLRLPFQSLVF